ncbi:MAG: CoA pyrophosphatase [Sphingobacteriales bacterium]|nr:MAG: CoA pyrophosphatase [Sphingobacteriales bacterium]
MQTFNWTQFKAQLAQKLVEPLPGSTAHERMLPAFRAVNSLNVSDDARESGVLLLLYPDQQRTHLVLIQRSNDGGSHSGQIALPGGKREMSDRDIVHTALREANEEISLDPENVEIAGQLSPLFVSVSNFLIRPVIAFAAAKPQLHKSDYEVARILYADLEDLFASRKTERIIIPSKGDNMFWEAPVYKLDAATVVWGATAMILSELELLYETISI